jgi:hypothetical protein
MSDFDDVRRFANSNRGKRSSLYDRATLVVLTEIATSLKNMEKLLGSVVVDGRFHVKLRSEDD